MVRAIGAIVVLAAIVGGCDSGSEGDGDRLTISLWVRYAVESEVGIGTTAYATFYDGDEDGDSLELEDNAVVTCNGKRLEVTLEAWSRLTYYKSTVQDLGEGGRYNFTLTRGSGEEVVDSLTLPSAVTIETADSEVQPGRDATVELSPGTADELQVAVVATCLAPAEVSLEGSAESATIDGDSLVCACAAGGLEPPCEGVFRAQRISRGTVSEVFAGGETLGVQRHEVDVQVIAEE